MLGWELPPHNSGGLGVACYQLCKSLAERRDVDIEFVLPYTARHQIEFMTVTAAHPQDVTEVLRAGIAYDSAKYIFASGHSEHLDIVGQQELYAHSIDRVVSDKTYDIIHAHDWLTFRAALRARELTGSPLVVHLHSIERDRAGGSAGNPLVREIEQTALLLADRIIAVSHHTKRAIHQEYGIPMDAIEVVHNSLDKTDLAPLDADNAYVQLSGLRKHGYRVVGTIGRLTVQKGLVNLLRAAQLVVAKHPKTMFLIVGDGEQYRELLRLSGDLGIAANVVFAGFQRGKRWRDAFAVSDLFVMPSVSEPFGLTPLEAIHYGTPSLISRQSGVAEVLSGCLKVDFWDIQEMADKIVNVVRHDELRDELAITASHEYERLSWNDSVDKLYDVYRQHAVSGGAA